MNIQWTRLALALTIGFTGCSMFHRRAAKGSPQAQENLLQKGEQDIARAEAKYKEIVLKHGESSIEAVQAKTDWNEAKNKYAANQTHVQQLQRMDAEGRPAVDPSLPTSGNMYPQQQ